MDFILSLRTQNGDEIDNSEVDELYYQITEIMNREEYETSEDLTNEIACFLNERGWVFDFNDLILFIVDELMESS